MNKTFHKLYIFHLLLCVIVFLNFANSDQK